MGRAGQQDSVASALADARRSRRQRSLERIEIPEDHVTLTDELLGKGGFGAVYIADYNGRNAAAKVGAVCRPVCVLGYDWARRNTLLGPISG